MFPNKVKSFHPFNFYRLLNNVYMVAYSKTTFMVSISH